MVLCGEPQMGQTRSRMTWTLSRHSVHQRVPGFPQQAHSGG